MKRSKWLTRVNIILLAILLVGTGFVLLYPVNPLTINSVVVEGKEFKAGGELTFKVDRCKSVDETTDGTATRYLVDQKKDIDPYFLSSTDDLGPQGCRVSERNIILPAHIPDGEYKLCFIVKYYPSVLRPAVKKEFCSDNTFHVKGLTVAAQLETILEQLRRIDPSLDLETISEAPTQSNGNVSNVAPIQTPEEPVTPVSPTKPEATTPPTITQRLQSIVNNLLENAKL